MDLGERVDVTDTGGVEDDGDRVLGAHVQCRAGPYEVQVQPREGEDGRQVEVGLARRQVQQPPLQGGLFGAPPP